MSNKIFPQSEIIECFKSRFGRDSKFELSTDSTKYSLFLRVTKDLGNGEERVDDYQLKYDLQETVLRRNE